MAAPRNVKRRKSSRHRKRARVRVDRRTAAGRRIRALVGIFIRELGGSDALSDLQRVHIATAAELRVIAETARANYIQGRENLAEVVKVEGQASRAERALAIGHHKPSGPSLNDYLERTAIDA